MVVVVGLNIWVPESALVPVQPLLPVQLVALVELHVKVVGEPEVREVGVALKVTVGTGVVTVMVML